MSAANEPVACVDTRLASLALAALVYYIQELMKICQQIGRTVMPRLCAQALDTSKLAQLYPQQDSLVSCAIRGLRDFNSGALTGVSRLRDIRARNREI